MTLQITLKDKTVITYSDGGSRGNPGPSAIGVVLTDVKGKTLCELGSFVGTMTNNQAEYRALLKALEQARNLKAKVVRCVMDSQLAVEQICGRYKVKSEPLRELLIQVRHIERDFKSVSYEHVLRSHPMITRADKLVNQALDRAKGMKGSPLTPAQGELF